MSAPDGGPTATPSQRALVSVVIPTRGRPELAPSRRWPAIVAQDYAGPMEILVVHDGEDADPTLAELSAPDRRVSLDHATTARPGLAGARNCGLRHTSGPIVASCDDDDLWHPEKIRRQVDRLEPTRELLAVGTGIRLLMGDRDVDWPGARRWSPMTDSCGNRVKELHSSTLAMRRIAFAKAGEYDEELPHGYGEDYDWLLRASRVGRVGVVTEVLADIRKDVPSWFRGTCAQHRRRARVPAGQAPRLRRRTAAATPGSSGQIAYARGDRWPARRARFRFAGRALRAYPARAPRLARPAQRVDRRRPAARAQRGAPVRTRRLVSRCPTSCTSARTRPAPRGCTRC